MPATNSKPMAPTTAGCRCRAWRPTRRAWRSPAARSARAWHRGRHVPRAQTQKIGRIRLQPAVRRRTRRGLDLGSGDVGGALEARQPDLRLSMSTTSRPTAPRARCCRANRSSAKWEAFGWHAQRVDGNDIGRAASPPSTRARAYDSAAPRVIICDTRMGKGVPFLEQREQEPLPSRRTGRMEARARGARCERESYTMTSPSNASRGSTTSAMIASIAAEGQQTQVRAVRPRAGRTGAEPPDIVGMTADLGKYTDLHIFAEAYPDSLLSDGHGRAVADGRRRRHGARRLHAVSPRPTPSSPRAAPTTSSAWRSPKKTLTSRSSCALPGLTTRIRTEPSGDRGPCDLPRACRR